MMYSLLRNRSSVPRGGCTQNYLSQKEHLSASPYLVTTCAPLFFPAATTPSAERSFLFVAGTGICGVQTPMSSGRSVGSTRVRRRNHLLEYMGTCAVSSTAVGTSNTDLSSHSSTFSGGPRSCIEWRFACVDRLVQFPKYAEAFNSVIEVQAFLVTLIRRFDISLADKQPQIRRAGSGVLVPSVRGEEHKGSQLPLKITVIGNE